MKEFFGFVEDTRTPEGAYSWQHLTFVFSLIAIMIGLAVFLGLRNRNKSLKEKNRVLIISAILIDAFEIFKIIIFYLRDPANMNWLGVLPLYLCSIQLITIPLAAFSKGRLKEASLDFVFIFGILGALAGTIGAAQNYNAYPVLSFTNVVSNITHDISGFASLYIGFSLMYSMKKENIWLVATILLSFMVVAYIVDITCTQNYMFLIRHDGTPYVIFYNLVNGNKVLYPLMVLLLFALYVTVFYLVLYLITKKSKKNMAQ